MNKVAVRVLVLVLVVAAIVAVAVATRTREGDKKEGVPAPTGLLVQMIGGKPGAWNLKERMDGFAEIVKGTEVVLADIQYNQENPDTALQVAESVINAQPGLRGFFCSNAFAGPGAALAIKGAIQRGKLKEGQVRVVAFDTTDDILDFIEQGVIACTLAQNTAEMGRIAIEKLMEFAAQYREKKAFDRPSKGKDIIDTGVSVVTKAEVSKYRAKPPTKTEPVADPKFRFALVPKSIGHPYWEGVREGMNVAAARLGVHAVFQGPPEASIEEQIRVIEGLMAQGYDGIAISPNDPDAVKEIIKRAMAKGIAVVTFDSDSPDSERLVYIGTDNREAGRVGARQMLKLLGLKQPGEK